VSRGKVLHSYSSVSSFFPRAHHPVAGALGAFDAYPNRWAFFFRSCSRAAASCLRLNRYFDSVWEWDEQRIAARGKELGGFCAASGRARLDRSKSHRSSPPRTTKGQHDQRRKP
jgi:hypothetical protein